MKKVRLAVESLTASQRRTIAKLWDAWEGEGGAGGMSL